MEDQELDTGYADFMEAFDDNLGNQTEESPEETVESSEDTGADTADQSDDSSKETPEGSDSPEPANQEQPAEDNTPDSAPPSAKETFTIKVNEEERTCTREEMISLAQKGADYDLVLDKLNGQQETMDLLAEVAKESGTDVPGLLDSLRLNLLKKQGLSEDAARERLERQKLEKENAALKAEKAASAPKTETAKERAQREIAEFRKNYPKVELTEELGKQLMPDIKKGLSMTEAYRNYEATQKDARIAELELQLAAQKQNATNRASSPGSQKDSGGRRTKTDFDDFMRALE